nr:ectin-like [Pocillopora verrucosa]
MVLKCKGACNLCGDKDCPDHVHCHSWKQRGFCRPGGPYYSYMKAYCPATCELCGCVPEPNNDPSCAFLTKAGYCNPKHRFYGYMMNNCQHSCGFCPGSSKTEPTTSTTSASSTTAELSTTPSPSTTGVPSTTSSPSTTSAPSTTSSPSTTGAPSTKSGLSTTGAPSTTSDVSTTGEQSTSSSNTTAALTAEVNACLKAHNERRALHGASPLVWDDTLREHAQAWADHLAETGKIRHDPNRDEEGENIAWFKGYRTAGCEDALMEWYDREEPKYDYRNPGFSPETGQFTQVVWKDTRAVGVAQASRGSGFSKQIFIVARYSPSGNFILRRFKENVVERRNQPNTTPSWKRSSTRGSKTTPDTLVTRKAVTSIQPSAPTTSLTAEVKACLKAHNERRALHGASPLVWDDTLVEHAQVWADHLAATGKIHHDPNRDGEGENIAWFKGYKTADCEDALVGWYDREEPMYDYAKPGFSPETGHFSQVVWKATTAVGVAQASRGSGFSKEIFIVARYSPTGNVLRRFQKNVGVKRSKS